MQHATPIEENLQITSLDYNHIREEYHVYSYETTKYEFACSPNKLTEVCKT